MKIRTDFVTNSSSSSFCIIGVPAGKIECENYCDLSEDLYDNSILKLDYIMEPEYGFVGVDIETMKDDQTLGEFKKIVFEALTEKFPESGIQLEDVSIHVDGGYDG